MKKNKKFNRQVKQTAPSVVMRHIPTGYVFHIARRTAGGVLIDQPTFRQGMGSNGRFTGIYITGPQAGLQPRRHVPIEDVEIIAESYEDYDNGVLLSNPLRWDPAAQIWK